MDGGETKGKGPIELDWDKLLRDDEKPPQLVVERTTTAVSRAEKRKRQSPEMGDSDELGELLRGMTEKALVEKIARMKSSNLCLPDGGERFRKSIKRHEDELERRRLHRNKDDKQCKTSAQFHDLSCSSACDSSREEAQSSLPNHESEFAKSFCKKIEEDKNVFRKELSALNRCDSQRSRSNGHRSSNERLGKGLSSRQTPFRCPSNLSISAEEKILSNGDQNGRCLRTSSHYSKFDLATPSSKRRHSSEVQHSSDQKRKNTVVLVDEDEHGTTETTQQVDKDQCMKEAKIYYPSRDDPESIEIRFSDLECLAPETYVSSTIMNFYIRYLQQHKQRDYQFFNTYFYQKLKEAVQKKNDEGASFAKVRRWWKGVKLFEKAYIFLPIHEQLHWSLVIICIPDKEARRGPIILHLDSLGFHPTDLIFRNIKRFLIGEWEFLKREEDHLDLLIRDQIWDNLPRRIQEKSVEVPQQMNDYDCGLFVLYFMEHFIKIAPERVKENLPMFGRQWFKPEEASNLRYTIRDLLKEEFKRAKETNCLLPS